MKLLAISVSVLVYAVQGDRAEFLLLRRIPAKGGFWQSVSGNIEGDETARDTAIREVLEETGLQVARLLTIDHVNSFYDEERDAILIEPFFGAKVERGEVRLSAEHCESTWLPFRQARERMSLPSHRMALDALIQQLAR